jgi:hypothetical protein
VGVAQVMRSGEPELVQEVTQKTYDIYVHDDRTAQIARELGVFRT